MKCNVCGNEVPKGAKECAVCGTKVELKNSDNQNSKEKFFNEKNQIFFVGLIALFLLFYYVLINIINYDTFAAFRGDIKTLGIVGLILSIPTLIIVVGLMAFQLLYIFRKNIISFDKIALYFPFVGFICHCFIAFVSLLLAIWRVSIGAGAADFFSQIFLIFGLQAIHIWLFLIAEKPKNIFPTKPAKPNEVNNSESNNKGE